MNHPTGKQRQQDSVAEIAKHNGKEEGESNDGKDSGVYFLVVSNSVRVYDALESTIGWYFEGDGK